MERHGIDFVAMRASHYLSWERSRDPLDEQRHNSPEELLRSSATEFAGQWCVFPHGRPHEGGNESLQRKPRCIVRRKHTDDFTELLRT